MRRLARWLFTLCSAVSLLAFIAGCVLWVRSHRAADSLGWNFADSEWSVAVLTHRNGVTLAYLRYPPDWYRRGEPAPGPYRHVRPAQDYERIHPVGSGWNQLGFSLYRDRSPKGEEGVAVCPYWAAVLAALIAPATWVWRHRREGRAARAGLCPACDYDLRATPDRCPECGTKKTDN
jgi:hypothetical protein